MWRQLGWARNWDFLKSQEEEKEEIAKKEAMPEKNNR